MQSTTAQTLHAAADCSMHLEQPQRNHVFQTLDDVEEKQYCNRPPNADALHTSDLRPG